MPGLLSSFVLYSSCYLCMCVCLWENVFREKQKQGKKILWKLKHTLKWFYFFSCETTNPVTIRPIITAISNRIITFRRYFAWYSAALINSDRPASTSLPTLSILFSMVSEWDNRTEISNRIVNKSARELNSIKAYFTDSFPLMIYQCVELTHNFIYIEYVLFDLSNALFTLLKHILFKL